MPLRLVIVNLLSLKQLGCPQTSDNAATGSTSPPTDATLIHTIRTALMRQPPRSLMVMRRHPRNHVRHV
jgi:hypothetical protein